MGIVIPSVPCDFMNQAARYWSSVPYHPNFPGLGAWPLGPPLATSLYVLNQLNIRMYVMQFLHLNSVQSIGLYIFARMHTRTKHEQMFTK